MRRNRLLIICLIGFAVVQSCNSNADKEAVTNDTDSARLEEKNAPGFSYEECYQQFFKGLDRFKDSNSAYLLFDSGKRVTITQFFKEEFMSQASQYGKKDIDGDNSPELIIYNNTGGAHCCDEYYIFHAKNDTEYQFSAHLMGGNTCIDPENNSFTFSFSETLGYFFTCYACGFADSIPGFENIREIRLKYDKGKLAVQPYNAGAEKQNIANLEILQKSGFQPMEDMMDNGWRKEFAMNLAVWHFNHDKNWTSTKQIFSKYYNFPDSARIWKEFFSTLNDTRLENTF